MPIYEYRCDACGHEMDAMQKMSDAPLTDCPSCGKPALRKMISAAGFHLKGSGWYQTDFKSAGKKSADNSSNTGDKTDQAEKKGDTAETSGGHACSGGGCHACS